jgi:hypothetical protein
MLSNPDDKTVKPKSTSINGGSQNAQYQNISW